jgi:hypothetical protein
MIWKKKNTQGGQTDFANGVEKFIQEEGDTPYTYVIFDDYNDMLFQQQNHFVLVNSRIGLTQADIDKAKKNTQSMKISDIKGEVRNRIAFWISEYINNLVFDEIKMVAPTVKFRERISIWGADAIKKIISGAYIGYPTHGHEAGTKLWKNWSMGIPQSWCCNEQVDIDTKCLDIYDPNGLFKIEVDLVDHYGDLRYWDVMWSIKADRGALMAKLSDMFDKDVEKVKNATHEDCAGQRMNIGDIICYSTTYDNGICLGTISKFNDYTMVVDGHDVSYDSQVIVVNKEIQYNEKFKRYEHR